jgi:hypothetical protein
VRTRIRGVVVAAVKALLDCIALLFLGLVRASRPLWRLTIIKGTAAFYGHLALEPENDLCVRDAGLSSTWARQHAPRSVTWWNFGKPADSPNPTLLRMWKRSITIPPSWWIAAILRVSNRHAILAPDIVDASLFGVGNALDTSPTHLRVAASPPRTRSAGYRRRCTHRHLRCARSGVLFDVRCGVVERRDARP